MSTEEPGKQNMEWIFEQQELERLLQVHGYENKEEIAQSENAFVQRADHGSSLAKSKPGTKINTPFAQIRIVGLRV